MDATTALLRIAAQVASATAALVVRDDDLGLVAAWGCDDAAASALLRIVRDDPEHAGSLVHETPLTLGDERGRLLLVAPQNRDVGAVLARIAGELALALAAPPAETRGELDAIVKSIDQLADAIAIINPAPSIDVPATFVHVNPAFTKLMGYPAADLAGAPLTLMHGSMTDMGRVQWIRHRLIDRNDARAVVILYTQDATPLWTEMTYAPMTIGGRRGEYFVATYRDVTSRKQFEDSLASEKRKLQTTLAAIADAVVTVLEDGRVEFVNAAAQRLLGIELVDAYGSLVTEVVPVVDEHGAAIDVFPAGNDRMRRGEGHLRTKVGTVDIAFVASKIDDGHGHVVVLRDVTAEHRLALRLSFEASHDPLTGLPNRRAFLERLENAVQHARESDANHVVAFLDLDRFKVLNDRFGHATGDRLLREIARVMGRVVRGGDVLARIGGDEFALLLSDCRLDDARRVADKMRRAVDAYRIEHRGEVLGVGVSIGLAPIEGDTPSAQQALALADAACYQAKAAGRNAVAG